MYYLYYEMLLIQGIDWQWIAKIHASNLRQ